MDLAAYIDQVVADGIAGAQISYGSPQQRLHLEGAVAGFEACRGKSVTELKELLFGAREETRLRQAAPFGSALNDTYWYARCFELEVEWVCNCVAAILINEGRTSPFPAMPTARGVLRMAEILRIAQ